MRIQIKLVQEYQILLKLFLVIQWVVVARQRQHMETGVNGVVVVRNVVEELKPEVEQSPINQPMMVQYVRLKKKLQAKNVIQ